MKLPETMRAIDPAEPGGAEVLQVDQRPVPRPGPEEVLIRVAAAGINRPDVLQRMGRYPMPPGAPTILGLEAAGEIVAVGERVASWRPGDRVCALLMGGGYAEYATAPAGQCLPVPAGLSMIEAASLPETYFTVWSNLVDRAQSRSGETLLVHGGTSGIGTTAIQLARALGLRVFTTAGSAEKCAAARELGAALAVNYREESFVERVGAVTEGAGVEVVLDIVGGEYFARNLECLGAGGRHVSIAFLKGARAELDIMTVLCKGLVLTGSMLRPQSTAFKAAIARALERHVWPMFADGRLRPVIDSRYQLEDVAQAHRRMEASAHIGKIVLEVNG